ncbi:hypothetical protein IV203_017285 [Nitzschia inconspicua]|uniref:Apolipophorin-III n=1 Tax=Nitzschia inconspicua TaxID=303405 RepID=A0A9K3PIM4_9STRA|nr:hypothetical protein IV203_017285 [Nitzschia inconspicua]
MKTPSRSPFRSFCFLLVWMAVLLLSSSSSTSLVHAQEEAEERACDCSADIESAKQDTASSFQATINELNHKLSDAAASVTGKDGEIAELSAQIQEVTSAMTAKVEELTSQLETKVKELDVTKQTSKALESALEQMKSSFQSAQEEADQAKTQVSKYLDQRFFINMTLLKQDLNNLLKKLGFNKGDEL